MGLSHTSDYCILTKNETLFVHLRLCISNMPIYILLVRRDIVLRI